MVPVLSDGLRRCTRLAAIVALWALAGCATVQNADPRDPYEGFNRAMFAFNEGFDDAIGKPVATVYRELLPIQIRVRVRNFYANIQDLMIGVNNLLQGKPADAWSDWTRFVINSSVGLLGLHDIASEAGLEKHNEDFGQTFAVWGMDEGPFFVWPFIGPNTLRDTFGFAADIAAAPVRWAIDDKTTRYWMAGIYLVSERAELLDVTTTLDEAAIDKYLQRRDAYFERRRYLIFDGRPPRPAREPPRGRETRSEEARPPATEAARQQSEPATAPNAQAGTFAPREPSNYGAVLAAPRGKL